MTISAVQWASISTASSDSFFKEYFSQYLTIPEPAKVFENRNHILLLAIFYTKIYTLLAHVTSWLYPRTVMPHSTMK